MGQCYATEHANETKRQIPCFPSLVQEHLNEQSGQPRLQMPNISKPGATPPYIAPHPCCNCPRRERRRKADIVQDNGAEDEESSPALYGRLHDSNISDWLLQRGEFAPPKPADEAAELVGGIRILVSERQYYYPPSLSISQSSYLQIEEEFCFPPAALHVLFTENGHFSRFEVYEEEDATKLKRLCEANRQKPCLGGQTLSDCDVAILIKVPQKFQVGNHGLALTFDVATRTTSALLVGTGVMQGGNDYHIWPKCPSGEIFDALKAAHSLVGEPMLLATLLLQHHISRTEIFCLRLDDGYTSIQRRMRINRAGRMHQAGPYEDPVGNKTINAKRTSLRFITGELSTYMTEITWYCKVSEWQCECMAALERTLHEVAGKVGTGWHAGDGRSYRAIKECVEFLTTSAKGLSMHCNGSKDRAEADLGVVCWIWRDD
jgi:hypothetical protein